MSITSVHIAMPVSAQHELVMGVESRRLLTSPCKQQRGNTTHNLKIDVTEIDSPTVTGTDEESHTTEAEPVVGASTIQPLPSKSVTERARAATGILNRYRIEYKNDWEIPKSVQHAEGQIRQALAKGVPIELVIPAFPFKSSNRSKKVLGPLPDEAERLSLLHLNGLCLAIGDAAESETFLTIVSDGITYNDILGVPDREVWQYGEQLRRLARQNRCHNIRFARICDLVSTGHGHGRPSENLTEELYLAKVSEYRDLLTAMTPPDFDVPDAITNDPDIAKTYKGYKKFLMSERDDRPKRSRSQTERENSAIAKAMILRGKAFAEAVRIKYPDSIRLSIHPSNDTNKVSIGMLPQDNEVVMTPWHGAVVRGADGRVAMTHAILIPAMTHEIVYDNEHNKETGTRRPSYFRERSELFDWNLMEKGKGKRIDVVWEYMYPCGVIVRPATDKRKIKTSSDNDDGNEMITSGLESSLSEEGPGCPLSMVDMQKVRALALTCSPVVLRGFYHDAEVQAGSTAEKVLHGDDRESEFIPLAVKEGMGQVTRERKKNEKLDDATTIESAKESISTSTSHFRTLTRPSSSSPASSPASRSLFASSELFARYLPQAYNIKKLEKIRWSSYPSNSSSSNNSPSRQQQRRTNLLNNTKITKTETKTEANTETETRTEPGRGERNRNIPLVATHPIRGTPCIQWPRSRLLLRRQSPQQSPQIQLQNQTQSLTQGQEQEQELDFASDTMTTTTTTNSTTDSNMNTQMDTKVDMDIRIENGTQNLIPLIDGLLLDRRVCLRFEWEEGDIVVLDDLSILTPDTLNLPSDI